MYACHIKLVIWVRIPESNEEIQYSTAFKMESLRLNYKSKASIWIRMNSSLMYFWFQSKIQTNWTVDNRYLLLDFCHQLLLTYEIMMERSIGFLFWKLLTFWLKIHWLFVDIYSRFVWHKLYCLFIYFDYFPSQTNVDQIIINEPKHRYCTNESLLNGNKMRLLLPIIKSKPNSISFWTAVIVFLKNDFSSAVIKLKFYPKKKKSIKALKNNETKKFYFCRVFVKKYLFFHCIENLQ